MIVEQKNFFVYASYTLERLAHSKCPSPAVTSIDFNDKDTAFGMVSADGFVYRFDLMAMKLKGDGNIHRTSDFKSCIFVEEPDGERFMTVGAENGRALLRVYNENEDNEFTYRDEGDEKEALKRFTEICTVRSQPNSPGTFINYVLGTEQGSIQVHSSTMQHFGVPFTSSSLHAGEVTRLIMSPDGKYLFSSGADGSIFIIQL